MGLFYVKSSVTIRVLFMCYLIWVFFYVYQPIILWVFFMHRDPLSIMGLSYVLPRPLYIRKTHNKMTVLYGSFLCTINFNERRLTPLATPTLHKKDP